MNILLELSARYKSQTIFVVIFMSFIFLRFYLLFQRANLGWDQIDSAWAANNILINKHFLINGPVAKGNSGIYMGPLYFYAITLFYFFTNLDPIASPIFQAIMSICSFFIIYFVTKKIFNTKVALLAISIDTFSILTITSDRIQSAFYLIAPISYLIFYSLYKILSGKEKYVFLLAIYTGISFHIDFTSIFYPIIILLSIPFFPRNKKMLKYSIFSIPLFLLFIFPTVIQDVFSKHSTSGNFLYLLHNYYHGFHLKRLLQIAHDGFISFEFILQFKFFRPFVFFILPIFGYVYFLNHSRKQVFNLIYLMTIWIIIPWIVLSTYKGELTDYYFSISRYIAIAILAYLTYFLLQRKQILIRIIPILFWVVYGVNNLQMFFEIPDGNLLSEEAKVKSIIAMKQKVPFDGHNADYYIFYLYSRSRKQ